MGLLVTVMGPGDGASHPDMEVFLSAAIAAFLTQQGVDVPTILALVEDNDLQLEDILDPLQGWEQAAKWEKLGVDSAVLQSMIVDHVTRIRQIPRSISVHLTLEAFLRGAMEPDVTTVHDLVKQHGVKTADLVDPTQMGYPEAGWAMEAPWKGMGIQPSELCTHLAEQVRKLRQTLAPPAPRTASAAAAAAVTAALAGARVTEGLRQSDSTCTAASPGPSAIEAGPDHADAGEAAAKGRKKNTTPGGTRRSLNAVARRKGASAAGQRKGTNTGKQSKGRQARIQGRDTDTGEQRADADSADTDTGGQGRDTDGGESGRDTDGAGAPGEGGHGDNDFRVIPARGASRDAGHKRKRATAKGKRKRKQAAADESSDEELLPPPLPPPPPPPPKPKPKPRGPYVPPPPVQSTSEVLASLAQRCPEMFAAAGPSSPPADPATAATAPRPDGRKRQGAKSASEAPGSTDLQLSVAGAPSDAAGPSSSRGPALYKNGRPRKCGSCANCLTPSKRKACLMNKAARASEAIAPTASGFKGVQQKSKYAFQAKLCHKGRTVQVGYYPTAEMAAEAHDEEVRRVKKREHWARLLNYEDEAAASAASAASLQRLRDAGDKEAARRADLSLCKTCGAYCPIKAKACKACKAVHHEPSRYRGVKKKQRKDDFVWQAFVWHFREKRNVYVGTFMLESEAAVAHDLAAQRLLGQDAILNFTESEAQAEEALQVAVEQYTADVQGGKIKEVCMMPKKMRKVTVMQTLFQKNADADADAM